MFDNLEVFECLICVLCLRFDLMLLKHSVTQLKEILEQLALELARAGGVPAVGARAVDCWQRRSGHYNHQSFLIFFPSRFFPPSRPFLIEGGLGSKNLFSESCLECPKT